MKKIEYAIPFLKGTLKKGDRLVVPMLSPADDRDRWDGSMYGQLEWKLYSEVTPLTQLYGQVPEVWEGSTVYGVAFPDEAETSVRLGFPDLSWPMEFHGEQTVVIPIAIKPVGKRYLLKMDSFRARGLQPPVLMMIRDWRFLRWAWAGEVEQAREAVAYWAGIDFHPGMVEVGEYSGRLRKLLDRLKVKPEDDDRGVMG